MFNKLIKIEQNAFGFHVDVLKCTTQASRFLRDHRLVLADTDLNGSLPLPEESCRIYNVDNDEMRTTSGCINIAFGYLNTKIGSYLNDFRNLCSRWQFI